MISMSLSSWDEVWGVEEAMITGRFGIWRFYAAGLLALTSAHGRGPHG